MWKYVKCSYHLSLFLKGLESHHPYRAVISTHTSIPRCLHTLQFSVSTNHIYIPPICYTVESLWNLVKDCELLLLYNKITTNITQELTIFSQYRYFNWVKIITSILSWSNCFFINHKICFCCPLLWLSCCYFYYFHIVK